MPPKFIYFDLGNVLLNFDHRLAAQQMADVAGVDIEQVWQLVFDGALLRQIETGEIDDQQFYQLFCEATGTCPDYDKLQYAGSAIFTLNASIVPLVAHLKQAGYRLGILSNTSNSHWQYATNGRYGLLPSAFEIAILSYEVRSMKPDAEIYRLAAERAGCQPSEIFFTDDRQDNIAGALAAGFDAVLYTDTPTLARELHARGVQTNF